MTTRSATKTWSLLRRLRRGLLLSALLPVLLFGIALLASQWQRDRTDLLLRLDANARLSANVIDEFLESQLAGIRLMADRVGHDDGGANGRAGEALVGLLDTYPSMLRTLHVDADGKVLAARDTRGRDLPQLAGDVSGEAWFVAARQQFRPYISDVFRRDVYGNEPVVGVSAPILVQGRFAGALEAAIPVEAFVRISAESLARRKLELLLLDRNGRVIHAGASLPWHPMDSAGELGRRLRSWASEPARQGQARHIEGMLRSGGKAYVEALAMRNGWTLVLVAPTELLLAPLVPRLALLSVLLAITALGTISALWQQRRLLVRSNDYLLASLRGYALGGQIDDAGSDALPEELQPLARGMGKLGASMNAAYGELSDVLEEREKVIAERTASLREAVAQLDRLSQTDGLTGALNYRGFVATGRATWESAVESGRPLAVLALDIDHFKRYNDHYGHADGDGALRRFAGAVRSALLHADDVLARPGGEEFTVFLPGTDLAQALAVGERVCARVRDADIAHAGSAEGRVTVSVGVAALQDGDADIEDVLRRADEALYRAKAAGRNRASL